MNRAAISGAWLREKCAPSPRTRSASLHLLVTLNQVIEAHTSKPHAAGAEVSNASHHPSIPGLHAFRDSLFKMRSQD